MSISEILNTYPKVGIRPAIDGRDAIRKPLEEQTQKMAQAAAKLISDNLKNPDGKPVECVIAGNIGGVAESTAADILFRKENVGVTLTLTPCWAYGSETMDMDPHRPKAVWGFNGTERPGAVYLAATLAAHNQKGLPAFSIYGKEVQDLDKTAIIPEDVKEKILAFVKAGMAAAIMRGKSYLSIGNVSMGIAGSIVDPNFFEDYLGIRCEYADMTEVIRRIDREVFDKEEFKKALSWVKKNLKEGPDTNPKEMQKSRERKDWEWEFIIKMAMICKDLMNGNPKLLDYGFSEEALGHNAIAGGFQGQRNWTDHFPNGDFAETILNSSFDWNGIRKPYIFATENDCLNGVAMLFGYLLTNTAQIFADVRTFWSPEAIKRVSDYKLSGIAESGIIHLINSGSAAIDGCGEQKIGGKPALKPFWEITEQEVNKCLDACLFNHAVLEYFRGGGFSVDFLTKGGMPITMSRVNLIKGLGPVLQIAEGYSVALEDNIHNLLDKRTNPQWPTTWFVPKLTGKGAFTDTYTVMKNWGANHGSFSFGHIGADLITLASILRIPVCMHNVEENRILRPHAWAAFGTSDLEGADYRACKNYGPLYRKG
ncbi:MAG: L-fucose isomerase [Actinobacteria bacterium]|nr:L-fucose isomerase [Actinomycetota bacterium]